VSRSRWVVAAAAAFHLVAGLLILPYPGIEADEALFAGGIYSPERMAAAIELAGRPVATMIMGYIGALKAWLYTPIFSLLGISVWTLRVPVLLAGVATVWLFASLLARLSGPLAAAIGALLLATDPIFLTTTVFDWGPVALQQLLLVGAMLALVRFAERRKERDLVIGCFALGLALWHKAVLLWLLVAMAASAAALAGRELFGLAVRYWSRAAGAFLLGALPFVFYNLDQPGQAWSGRRLGLQDLAGKIEVMKRSVRGDAMAGFLVAAESNGEEAAAETAVERASLRLSDLAGRRISGIQLWLVPVAAAGLFSARSRRTILFFAMAFLVAWAQMLVTVEAGGSVHHTVMLWPFLHAFLAVGLAAVASFSRWAARLCALLVLSAATMNALATNEHLARLVRFGAERMWTDAIFELAERVRASGARYFHPADWGMGDQVRLLAAGGVMVEEAVQPFSRESLDEEERRRVLERVERPDAIFARYVPGWGYFPAAACLLEEAAREAGFEPAPIGIVQDRRGRPVFELFAFRPGAIQF
jgi:4-amino-4-deoxy-L-arabinose transferase-like glycosyltransferase